ncbi:MAG TPA: MASE1 domain-containing protein, partial [Hyphomicrobiaceae bacterium]|nr:MASE1 domain-containing protein [Hyphomicrobiaceae bacterium]
MAFPRLLSLPPHVIGFGYLLAYIALDWISFVHPYGPFAITPWNPSTGLSFVLVLLFGLRHLPMLFLAPVAADLLIRGVPAGFAGVLGGLVIGGGYSVAAFLLLRPLPRFDVSLSSTRDLFLLLLVAAGSSSLVAVAYISIHVIFGQLPMSAFSPAILRFWIGDLIGIAVVTPFLLILLTRGALFDLGWDTAMQVLLLLFCLLLAFGTAQGRQLQLFYLLFLPIIWIAIRAGLEGVTAGLVLTQLGLIVALQMQSPTAVDVTTFQALMLILTLTGLAAGALVTERRRAELQLRLQQDAQARLTRLGSMGELASAL